MLQNLLPRIPVLSRFFFSEATPNSSKAIRKDNSNPIYVIILPPGDHSELKKKLQEQFNEYDLRFETDRSLIKSKFKEANAYMIEVKAPDKMDSEQLFQSISAQIKEAHLSPSQQSDTGGTSQKELTRRSLEELSRPTGTGETRLASLGVHVCGPGCNHGHTGSGMLSPPARQDTINFNGSSTRSVSFTPTESFTPARNSISISRRTPTRENLQDKLLNLNTSRETIHKYIEEKIAVSNDPNLHKLRNGNNDAQLEQSDPISQEINRELAKRDGVESSMGIALTGQFSFIDRKDYHIESSTYN